MRFSLLIHILLFITASAFGQETLSDSGFTNKAEAQNKTVDGVKQGKWIEFVDNGDRPVASQKEAVYSLLIVYKDGLPFGTVRKYDGGYLFWSIPYINGRRNGVMRKWYFNKKVKSEIPFVNDTISGIVKDYYEAPNYLKCETPYLHGLMKGVQKSYRADGKSISSEIEYSNGKKNGLTRQYYVDDKLQYEIPYFDNMKNGIEKMYMENGKIAWEATFTKGYLRDSSVKAPKEGISDSIRKTAGDVQGYVKVVRPWCTDVGGGDREAEYTKPRPLPNKKMYVKQGDSNYFSKPVIMEFTTDSNGGFHFNLPPGAYIIISDTKRAKPNYDSLLTEYANGSRYCVPINASDTICMNKWYKTPDASFIIGNNSLKDVTITYHLPCFGDCELPCIEPRIHRI
jgi:antitoxin component YwqK of YwqJK toxin-antitoxin module